MTLGLEGLRMFNRVPEGGVFGRTGLELLRPYRAVGTLEATVELLASLSLGARLEPVPSRFRSGMTASRWPTVEVDFAIS